MPLLYREDLDWNHVAAPAIELAHLADADAAQEDLRELYRGHLQGADDLGTGRYGEAHAMRYLQSLGLQVVMAAPGQRGYDLLVTEGDQELRVQVKGKLCRPYWERQSKGPGYHYITLKPQTECGFDRLLVVHVGNTFLETVYYGPHPDVHGQESQRHRLFDFIQDYAADHARAQVPGAPPV